ncbi:MAG TPA: hypothetical protein EYG90_02330 [Campylobacterales bacterium]|nr:hypothetical protein [Campylobacterales bacterium]
MEIGDIILMDNEYGIGKIVAINQNKMDVEFFINIGEQVVEKYSMDEGQVIHLGIQTRVYIEDEDALWKIGRVVDFDDATNPQMDYEIQFSNQKKDWYGTDELKSRCLLSLFDPTEVLGISGGETQFLYESRRRVLEWMISLRASSRGLSAVTSASIDLVSHQINIARKILTDPIQRYLLSDEVGMGKTIEAGIIARQCLLDSVTSEVLIVVPEHLLDKWYREMESRFYLNDFGSRVAIITPSEIGLEREVPELMIIDEAHHIIGHDDMYTQSTQNRVISMAKKSEKLLLLSATPGVGSEDVLLRLLKVLDPLIFKDETLETFKDKLLKQSEHSAFLRTLKVEQSSFLLKRILAKVTTLFPNDFFAEELANKILEVLIDESKVEMKYQYIRELKSHLTQIWQLHNRLIRTRRIDLDENDSLMFQDRGEKKEGKYSQENITIITHTNSSFENINSEIEEWRSYLSTQQLSSQRYIKLLEHSSYDFDSFRVLVDEYIDNSISEREVELLKNISASISDYRYLESLNEMSHQIEQFLNNIDSSSIGILFISDTHLAQKYCDSLKNIFEDKEVFIFDKSVINQEARVIICDKSAEEGVDFQFADAIIHLDLPLNPSRIEQRIGRLDRFGRAKSRKIQHLIIQPTKNDFYPWEAWFELLLNGFGVFSEPISDIQLKLKSISDELHHSLTLYGVEGLENHFDKEGNIVNSYINYISTTILKERESLDEQYALNYLSLQESDSLNLREEIEDSEYPEKNLERDIDAWLFDTLKFYKWYENSKTFEIKWDNKRTLVPKQLFVGKESLLKSDMWEGKFKSSLDRTLSYRRDEAVNNSKASLVRVGHPLFSALQEYLNWEDRGTAFSTFRVVEDNFPIFIPRGEIRILFKLHFIVEVNIDPNSIEQFNSALYQRRADDYFPPKIFTIYIDENMDIIEDKEIIETLNQPYSKDIDTNLSSRRGIINNFIDTQTLMQLCREVSQNSQEILKKSEEFIEVYQNALSKVKSDTLQRSSSIQRRVAMQKSLNPNIDVSEYERSIQFENALIKGVSSPCIRLDSFGMFFISRFPISEMDITNE